MESGAIRRKGLKPRLWVQLLYFRCNPAYHIAAHHAIFLASAICKVQLILRSCGCGGGAADAMKLKAEANMK